jgi:hypothetical protein
VTGKSFLASSDEEIMHTFQVLPYNVVHMHDDCRAKYLLAAIIKNLLKVVLYVIRKNPPKKRTRD